MMRRAPGHGGPASHHGAPVPGGPGQVSNVTNSNDFISKDSRVFVGNLNTFALNKENVDAIFRRYGMVTGISMHKGYAFVQFNHPGEARRSVAFEDGQMYAGQALDLNIVSEPKNRSGQKRHSAPMNDRRPPIQPHTSPVSMMPPSAKRPRQDSNPSLQRSNLVTLANSSKTIRPRQPMRPTPASSSITKIAAAAVKRATATVTKASNNATKSSSVATVSPTTDVLICGVCKMQFTSLHSLAQHKKIPCRLRASCQCQTNPPKPQEEKEPVELKCASCDAQFDSAWALCQHCQDEHSMTIFKTKEDAAKNNSSSITKNPIKTETSTEGENSKDGDASAKKPDGKNTTPKK